MSIRSTLTLHESIELSLSIPTERIAPLFDQARQAGLILPQELSALGLPSDLADTTVGYRISLADYYRIQNRFAQLLGDETCKLSPRHLAPGSTDMVLSNIKGCTNLYEVMKTVANAYNLLHGGQYNFVEKNKYSVDYIVDDEYFPYTVKNNDYVFFSVECALIFVHCIFILISPEIADGAVKSVSIKRSERDGKSQHLSYWNKPIRFNALSYRIRFDPEATSKRLVLPPPTKLTTSALYSKIDAFVRMRQSHSNSFQTTTERVRDTLSRGIVDQRQVAMQMGLSVATVRRRLDEEGASFRDLRRDALNDAAKHMLARGDSIPDVAEELGFSEFRSFNRAFKKWNGVTPKNYTLIFNNIRKAK